MVEKGGNMLGGALSKQADQPKKTEKGKAAQTNGVLNQVERASQETKKVGLATSALNLAKDGIEGTFGLVGEVTGTVTKGTLGIAGDVFGGFGKLVKRMTTSTGNKPTPVESYVGMVTKENPKLAATA